MILSVLRVIVGFVLACLAGGAVQVLFAMTPADLASRGTDAVAQAGQWSLLAAIHSAVFSAPFVLVIVALGEWRRIRAWLYYAASGVAIAAIGFVAQLSSELPGQPSIVNNYALTAFLTAGFVAGSIYWLLAGRRAGGARHPASAGVQAG